MTTKHVPRTLNQHTLAENTHERPIYPLGVVGGCARRRVNKIARLLAAALLLNLSISAFAATTAVDVDLEADWKNQYDDISAQLKERAWFRLVAKQAFRQEALILPSDRKPSDVALRRTEALLKDLAQVIKPKQLNAFEADLQELRQKTKLSNAEVGTPEDQLLFNEICQVRRKIAFANPLLDFDQIVFVKRRNPVFHHAAGQNHGVNAKGGGGVFCLSNPFGAQPELKNLLADSKVKAGRLKGKGLTGGFMSLAVSYDASTLYFANNQCARPKQISDRESKEKKKRKTPDPNRSMAQWIPEKTWHIFKVAADGSELEQLTDGDRNDFDPYPLPNGRLVFVSDRRGGFGRCHPTNPLPTFTLHSMREDGTDIVPLSYHETCEWQPSVNHDGMIVYTRWDYVDRGDCIAHHPWKTYPDGRDPRDIHGNYPKSRYARPDMELYVRAIPGSHRYVSTAAGHHCLHYGSLVIIDPDIEDDGGMAPLRRLTPEVPFPEVESKKGDSQIDPDLSEQEVMKLLKSGRMSKQYCYGTAWPLSELYYLAAYTPGKRGLLGIYLIDAFGNRELLHRDDGRLLCVNPLPLRPRKTPPVLPHATEVGVPAGRRPPAKVSKTGTITCLDVYNSLKPWPQGTVIKRLRVIQLFPKSTPRMNDPDIGRAPESLARGVLGTVPVEADGSVHFTAPAGKTFYFQALDEEGLAVQSMMSATYVHPGEHLSCQGCHERKLSAAPEPTKPLLALQREPSQLKPDPEGSYPLSFPRLVQPVLDRSCVPCHQKDETGKAPKLTAEVSAGKTKWTRSYMSLQRFAYGCSGKPRDRQPTRTTPGEFGARASVLYRKLKEGHNGLKLSDEDMYRITTWLDCNSNFFGAYHDMAKQARGELVMPEIE